MYPLKKYTTVLLKSTPKSINAEEAINMLFSKLKAAIVSPLTAPPVPKKPAKKPDKTPPATASLLPSLIFNLGFKMNNKNCLFKVKYY